MTTRQELLDRWTDRLFEAKAACDDPLTDSWSARIRRKLYRFLLTMYGHSDWPGPKDDVDNEAGRRKNTQLVIAEPQAELSGKEPRTRAQILKGLQNIKGLSEELAPAGPLGGGLHPNSPMVVASFRKRPRANSAFWRLKRLGFAPEMVYSGNQYQIFVIASLAPAAIQQLEEKRIEARPLEPAIRTVKSTAPVRIQSQPFGPSLSLLFGTFFGLVFCLMFWGLVQELSGDWSRAYGTNIPLPELIWGLGIGSIICLLVSFCHYRNWYQQLTDWTDVTRSLIFVVAVWLLLSGIGLLSLIFIVASPHFSIPRPEMVPSQGTIDRVAFAGATCIVVSVVLLVAQGLLSVGDWERWLAWLSGAAKPTPHEADSR